MSYTAEAIEVLSGLEPVQRRPGMYTDTTRPNHLAQEVLDNSVDEVIAGFASKIIVILHEDGSVEVQDDGRGMPKNIKRKNGIGLQNIESRLGIIGADFTMGQNQLSGFSMLIKIIPVI